MEKNTNSENKSFKETKLGWIPKDWEVNRVKDAAKVITGSTPSTKDLDNYGSKFLFAGPGDFEEKYIEQTTKMLSKKGFSSSRQVPKNSTLFVCIGSTIGKIGFTRNKIATNQQINAVYSEHNENEYLYYYLKFISRKIRNLAGEQALPMISKGEFQLFNIAIPPLPEQKAIANCLSTWDTESQN
jgi:type I restriction enzyme S subunit